MPAEIVSLNQYRKAKLKAEKENRSTENKIRYGRTKEERQRDSRETQKKERSLDGHRLELDSNDD